MSPEEVLGLHLTIGILVLIAATWLFGAIAEDVVNGEPLTTLDVRVSNAVQRHSSRPLTVALLVITNAHSSIPVAIFTTLTILYFLRRGRKSWALAFALSVFGGMLLNVLLKNVFHRARPRFDNPILTLTSYGFPSGHTMVATTIYGTLCVFALSRIRSWFWRVVVIVVTVLLIALVGFSRIYLGAHYLSDVLAAMAEGAFWVALCVTAVSTMRRWRGTRRDSNLQSE